MGSFHCPCRRQRDVIHEVKSTVVTIDENSAYEQSLQVINNQGEYTSDQTLDAIIVCGGGRPAEISKPPLYVQSRCDVAVLLYKHCQTKFGLDKSPKILCLSAGTAHTPQLLNEAQLPVWESYSSAQYILDKYSSFVEGNDVLIETVSYDTIGNAYFAKILHSDVLRWRRIAVITNDWHFDRTKAIFEWIFSVPGDGKHDDVPYNMLFVNLKSKKERDLSESARTARMAREANSLKGVQRLSKKYDSWSKVHEFLFTEHSMYASCKLEEQKEKKRKSQQADADLMAAYGFNDKKE